MNHSIRAWDPASDDVVALTGLLHRAYAGLLQMGLRFTATSQPPETTQERLEAGECFLLEVGGTVVGTVTLSFPVERWEGDPPYYSLPGVALLSQFGIEPGLQGKGLGRAMLDFALDWCRAKGAAELALDTSDEAIHLVGMYERWGFMVVARHRYAYVNYASVVMSRPVARPQASTTTGSGDSSDA